MTFRSPLSKDIPAAAPDVSESGRSMGPYSLAGGLTARQQQCANERLRPILALCAPLPRSSISSFDVNRCRKMPAE